MWPWSTIAKLRTQLNLVEIELGLHKDSLTRRLEDLQHTEVKLRECESRRRIAERNNDTLRKVCHENAQERDVALAARDALQTRVDILTEQLLVAQKNDQRDPKTGRFVKATS